MPEIALGCHAIADTLLQQLDVRKAVIAFPAPDQLIIAGDLEYPAGTWDEGDFAELGCKRGKKFLRHPPRPEQPLALRAIGDGDARFAFSLHAACPLTTQNPARRPGFISNLQLAYLLRKPNFCLNLLTRPPRSISVCWPPVQAGCDFGSISRLSVSPSLPQVERVWNLLPSVMTTLIMWYLGWMSFFMAEASFRRQRCTGFNKLSGCGRSYSEREIASQVRRLGPFCLDGG